MPRQYDGDPYGIHCMGKTNIPTRTFLLRPESILPSDQQGKDITITPSSTSLAQLLPEPLF